LVRATVVHIGILRSFFYNAGTGIKSYFGRESVMVLGPLVVSNFVTFVVLERCFKIFLTLLQ
jgi:hypothetical protein